MLNRKEIDLTPPCLTDYISIDSLQTFLDEASQQDGVALRLWSPQQMATGNSGWINDSWDNACQFHSLIRSYPSGQATCHQFFQDQADKIIKNKPINWHKTMCPTSLYIFGWPIYGKDKNILAIIFGGKVLLILNNGVKLKPDYLMIELLYKSLKTNFIMPRALQQNSANIFLLNGNCFVSCSAIT